MLGFVMQRLRKHTGSSWPLPGLGGKALVHAGIGAVVACHVATHPQGLELGLVLYYRVSLVFSSGSFQNRQLNYMGFLVKLAKSCALKRKKKSLCFHPFSQTGLYK